MRIGKKWLVLDCNYLCHRMFYAMGGLHAEGIGTGVVFGFLREVIALQEDNNTTQVAFCFDSRHSLRQLHCPEYKANRRGEERTEEEQAVANDFYRQVNNLRKVILPRIGYRNIFHARGYEADDLMAKCVRAFDEDATTQILLVSSDKDLYQLLQRRVSVLNPQKKEIFTARKFRDEYGIEPKLWRHVKALAGCPTDNVIGVPGVGEVTAAKYHRGQVARDSETWLKIQKGITQGIVKRNLPLVSLPYKGCPDVEIRADEISQTGWDSVIAEFQFKSMRGTTPFPGRSRRKRAVR